MHNLKKYMVYANIVHIQTTALLQEIFLFLLGVAYELQLVSYSYKAVSHYASKILSFLHFFGFCLRIPGVTLIVSPHPGTEHVLHRLQQVC